MPKRRSVIGRRFLKPLEALIAQIEETEGEDEGDIWRNYNPDRVFAALTASAGAFQGIDRQHLVGDIHAARQQNSRDRPA